jgi:DNA-binding NarL/FixJ family response regulator
MYPRPLNVYILDDNKQRAGAFRKALKMAWKSRINLSMYFGFRAFSNPVQISPDIVILNFFLNDPDRRGDAGFDWILKIKKRFPDSHIVIMRSLDEVILELEDFGCLTKEIKHKPSTFQRLGSVFNQVFLEPIRILLAEVQNPMDLPARR